MSLCKKNYVFNPRYARFVVFRTGRTTFKRFLPKSTSLYKTAFSAQDEHVLSFSHWAHHFLAIFSKVHEFVQNSLFSRYWHFLSISHWAHHFLRFSVKCTSLHRTDVFCPKSASFAIFALCTPVFSNFQQSA